MLLCIVSRHSHLAGCWLEIRNDNSGNHRICWNVWRNLSEHCFDLHPFPSTGNKALELIMAILLTSNVSKNILYLVRKLEIINNDNV